VLLAAGLFARSLTRPLVRLARAAPQLAQGESPDPRIGHEGPREVRELAGALLTASADVRAVARDRALMLAGLSHDLRTPLARLRLALEMLDGDADLRDGMVGDLGDLDAVIGQFIDYARDGREEALQSVDVVALLGSVAAQEWSSAPWQYQRPDGLQARVRPLALRRAVANLLRNAVRHGAAPFELELGEDAGRLRIRVADAGAGVPPDQLGTLGRPFFRADGAAPGGTGLGLAVAERVAALHGGGLQCRNRVGGGFEVLLTIDCNGSPARRA
jgi:two-component system, OmpR family, osmolarity sensor histidine kinase EnvZ